MPPCGEGIEKGNVQRPGMMMNVQTFVVLLTSIDMNLNALRRIFSSGNINMPMITAITVQKQAGISQRRS